MTSGETVSLDRSRLSEDAQQQLRTILDDLSSAWQDHLLRALGQVEVPTLEQWLHGHQLQDWIDNGLRGLAGKDGRNAQLAPVFFAATPQLLPGLSRGDLNEWSRLAFDIGDVDPSQVFSTLPDGLTELNQAERVSCYRLVRNAVYHSPQAAVALYRRCHGRVR